MDKPALKEISSKLIQIIQSKDAAKVRHWSRVIEGQKDPMITVEIFARVNHILQKSDRDLQQWFHDIYFENYQPELKVMWLDLIELCSLSL